MIPARYWEWVFVGLMTLFMSLAAVRIGHHRGRASARWRAARQQRERPCRPRARRVRRVTRRAPDGDGRRPSVSRESGHLGRDPLQHGGQEGPELCGRGSRPAAALLHRHRAPAARTAARRDVGGSLAAQRPRRSTGWRADDRRRDPRGTGIARDVCSDKPEDRDTDPHHGVTQDTVKRELEQAGFENVTVEKPGKRGFRVVVVVRKPSVPVAAHVNSGPAASLLTLPAVSTSNR